MKEIHLSPFADKYFSTLPSGKNKRELVKDVLEMWEKEGEPALQKYFNDRDGQKAKPLMLKYIAIYIQTNMWLAGHEVTSLESIGVELEKLSYAPMNIKERIEFVLQSPSQYHAFVTLTQLYAESRKKWAVLLK